VPLYLGGKAHFYIGESKMVADTKKCQTLINLCAEAAETLESIASQLSTYRDIYVALSIDPTGTALYGNEVLVSTWIDKVQAAADDPVTTGLIAAKVPTHRAMALEEE
jgi:hypothetical protein